MAHPSHFVVVYRHRVSGEVQSHEDTYHHTAREAALFTGGPCPADEWAVLKVDAVDTDGCRRPALGVAYDVTRLT